MTDSNSAHINPDGEDLLPLALRDFNWDESTCLPGDAHRTISGTLREVGWHSQLTFRVLREYKRFLVLVMKDEQPVVPCVFVDLMWRAHHNYPASYAAFCQTILTKVMEDQRDPEKAERTVKNVSRRLFEHDLDSSVNSRRYAGQYRGTIGFYLELFGKPPLDIWVAPAPRRVGW